MWNKPITEGHILHNSTYMRDLKFINLLEAENRMEVARDRVGGECGDAIQRLQSYSYTRWICSIHCMVILPIVNNTLLYT